MRMSRRPDRTKDAVVTDTPARDATSDSVTLALPFRTTADRSPEHSPLGHRRRVSRGYRGDYPLVAPSFRNRANRRARYRCSGLLLVSSAARAYATSAAPTSPDS